MLARVAASALARLFAVGLLLVVLPLPSRALPADGGCAADSISEDEPAAFTPKVKPEVQAQRITGDIVIDGRLDDAVWADAAIVSGFTEIEPNDQARPSVCTEVRVAYDDGALYLGFRAFDSNPASIRASLRNRDEIFSDDWVGVILDPYGDAAQAYEIFANPLGIQGDLLMSAGGSEDIGFDLVYRSEGRITDRGYVVEMAIPFSSLRFPATSVQEWNLTFLRTRPRSSRHQYSWATVDRDDPCFLCQFGTLSGLQGLEPSTNLDVLPALVGTQSAGLSNDDDVQSGLDNGRVLLEPSMNLRYNFTPSLAAEATVNPDFSQVESDAAQIDVNSTFALSFPERRPFFQEGSELFDTWIDVVYTRSINAPIAAGKTTGRFGRTSVAVLTAVDEETPMLLPFEEQSQTVNAGQSASTILRARRTFGENSFFGATVTDRRLLDADGSGSVVSADAGIQFWEKYRFEGQVAVSDTRESSEADLRDATTDLGTFDDGAYTGTLDGERFQGAATYLSLERNARHYGFNFDAEQYSPTFRTPNGFTTRNAYRRLSLWQGYTFYFENSIIERLEPGMFGFTEQNAQGIGKESYGQIQAWSRWKGQTFVFMNLGLGRERFNGVQFERMPNWNVNVNSNFSQLLRLGFNVNGGRSIFRADDPQTGRRLNASVQATLQPLQRLVIEPQVRYASLRNTAADSSFFSGYILRNKTSLQLTRELSVRLITQYNHFSGRVDVEPLVAYQINPFSVFYLGTTHDYAVVDPTTTLAQTNRQVFFKLQYLFRM